MFFQPLEHLLRASRRILLFATVGGVCLLIGTLIQWYMLTVHNLHYLIGYSTAIIVTSTFNWAMNRKWTFHSKDPRRFKEMIRHQAVNLFSLALSTIFFITLVSGFEIHYLIANFAVAIFMLGVNFFLQSRLVYRVR